MAMDDYGNQIESIEDVRRQRDSIRKNLLNHIAHGAILDKWAAEWLHFRSQRLRTPDEFRKELTLRHRMLAGIKGLGTGRFYGEPYAEKQAEGFES